MYVYTTLTMMTRHGHEYRQGAKGDDGTHGSGCTSWLHDNIAEIREKKGQDIDENHHKASRQATKPTHLGLSG